MTLATQPVAIPPLTLAEFLELPETKPASEFVDGEIIQKPMPQGEHSLLQGTACEKINQIVSPEKIAKAFPELRCTFGGRSIVPDVSVFRWHRIPLQPNGRVANRFLIHPDWAIEILSPEQSQTKVLSNLLHCIQNGTELGWLIDPAEDSILTLLPDQRIQLLSGADLLPTLPGIDLPLTVDQVFSWLSI
jgi:Uma2 family endonuclease